MRCGRVDGDTERSIVRGCSDKVEATCLSEL